MSNNRIVYDCFAGINKVEGFDPSVYAETYTDLNSGQQRFRLPVMVQLGWFRLVHPNGKTAVTIKQAGDRTFVAHARLYADYKDSPDHFLAEATASRIYDPQKPTISPREWAQTAALGIALRNAGFGLQFSAAGASFDTPAVPEEDIPDDSERDTAPVMSPAAVKPEESESSESIPAVKPAPTPSFEEQVQQAMTVLCPISKYKGKTLGEVAQADVSAIDWIAKRFPEDSSEGAAARLICEYAYKQASGE